VKSVLNEGAGLVRIGLNKDARLSGNSVLNEGAVFIEKNGHNLCEGLSGRSGLNASA